MSMMFSLQVNSLFSFCSLLVDKLLLESTKQDQVWGWTHTHPSFACDPLDHCSSRMWCTCSRTFCNFLSTNFVYIVSLFQTRNMATKTHSVNQMIRHKQQVIIQPLMQPVVESVWNNSWSEKFKKKRRQWLKSMRWKIWKIQQQQQHPSMQLHTVGTFPPPPKKKKKNKKDKKK